MNRQYLLLPAAFSIFLYTVVLGIVAVNLCDYSDTWSIIGCWGLVIVLAGVFRVYVFIPFAILWWTAAFFCETDGYSLQAVAQLTLLAAIATIVASVAHAIYISKDKKLNMGFISLSILFSIFCPPAAAAIGLIAMFGMTAKLTPSKTPNKK